MPTGENDFFLSFGSDAAEFSELLGQQIAPAIDQIYNLAQALKDFETQKANSSGGNILGNLFAELDGVTNEFRSLTRELAGTFQGAIRGIEDLQADLVALFEEVNKINNATSSAAGRRRAARGIASATQDEVAVTRGSDFNLGKIIDDARQARNALKRVGDINATLARNATDSADSLKILGQTIRTLTLQAKTTTKGLPGSVAAGQVVIVNNGGTFTSEQQVADLLQTVGGTPLVTEGAPPTKKGREELTSLSDPARAGQFLYEGKKLSVGGGVREGESFQDYFARIEAVKARIAEAYRQVPQLSSDFDEIIRIYKSAGNKLPQDLTRPTNQGEAQSRGDIVSTLGKIGRFDELTSGLGLTAGQRSRLPDALAALQAQIVKRDALIEQALRQMLAEDPLLTQDGLSDDAKRILRGIDQQIIGNEEYAAQPETPSYLGAANRQRIRDQGAEEYANRRALRDAQRDFDRRNGRFGSTGPAPLFSVDDRTESVRAFIPPSLGETVRVYHGRGEHDFGDTVHVASDATVAGRYAIAKSGSPETARLFQADIPASALEGTQHYTEGAKTFKIPAELLRQYGTVVAQGADAVETFVRGQEELISEFAALTEETAVNTQRLKQVQEKVSQATGGGGVQGRREELRKQINSTLTADEIRAELKDNYGFTDNIDSKGKRELARTLARKRQQDEAKAQASGGGAGGGSGRPPTAAAADDDSGAQNGNTRARKENADVTAKQNVTYRQHIALLSEDTKAVLANAREELRAADTEAKRLEILTEAGAVFREDAHVQTAFKGNSYLRNATFAEAVDLDNNPSNRRLVTDLFKKHGFINADPRFTPNVSSGGIGAVDNSANLARQAELEKLLAVEDLNLQNAYIREYLALEKLQTLEREEPGNLERILRARAELNAATLNSQRVESQTNPTTSQKIFGTKGFASGLLRNAGYGIENFVTFTLLFSGFEHLKEALEDATKAQVAFTRVQTALEATGRSADGLRTTLQGVATATAQSQSAIIEAAAELTGVLRTQAEIAQGAKISGELSNISEGALTAKEAAGELRDIIDAFGLSGEQSLQKVGDQVARISQLTGVSVKDVLEGTANLAQEAHDYKLSSSTAGILAAEVTKNTGETGEGASEQVSRILSTLNNGKVQAALIKFRLATREQFASGDIGQVLQQLLEGFDKLSPSAQQAIFSLVGAGRQARAFTGLLRDSTQLAGFFNGQLNSTGALATQNSRYLHTLGGELKQLGSDFRGLVVELQQLGLFDLIGVAAKALDDMLKILTEVGKALNSVFDSNPVTSGLKHVIATVGEAVIAFKLLRIAVASALGGGAAGAGEAAAEGVVSSTAGASIFQRASQRLAPNGTALASSLETRESLVLDAAGNPISTVRPFRPVGFVGRQLGSFVSTGKHAAETEASTLVERAALRASNATKSLANGLTSLGDVMIATGAESKAASIQAGLLNGVFAGLAIALPLIISGFEKEKQEKKSVGTTLQDLTGQTPNPHEISGTPQEIADNEAAQVNSYGKSYKDFFTGGPSGTSTFSRLKNIGDSVSGLLSGNFSLLAASSGSGGSTSDAFNTDIFNLRRNVYAKIRNAKTPEELTAAQKAADDELEKSSANLVKEAGDVDAQKVAVANLEDLKNSLNESADRRETILSGLKQIDTLNADQMVALSTFVQDVSSLNSNTIKQVQSYLKVDLQDSFFALGKGGGNVSDLLNKSIDPSKSTRQRNAALRDAIQKALPQEEYKLSNDSTYSTPGPQHDALKQAIQQQVQQLQQLNDLLFQQPIQAFGAAAELYASQGNYAQSVNKLQSQKRSLESYLKTLDKTQPEYWSTLKQIADTELQIAQQQDASAVNALNIEAAGTADAVKKANLQVQIAQKKLNEANQAAKAAGVPAGDKTDTQVQAEQDLRSAQLSAAQAQESKKEAQATAKVAGLVSQRRNLQNQLNEVLRQENVYRSGILKDDTKLAELEGQEATLRLQLLQQQQQDKYAREETQIALLQSRGGGNFLTGKNDDTVKAARLQLQEAQQKAKDYLSLPGASKEDAEYQQLLAQVYQAKRNAIDSAVNAQVDTLDFQVETYKISSAQEVEALRQILKNKQLTLAEQRSITEKIVSLQKQVRDELTSGGFNIPTDIKLPSAYQVRRSLGSTGGPTIVTTTNNTNNVTINNTVPTTALAQSVAKQVLNIINGSNAVAARANAPVPPLVGG